jgi:hypothetical protein
VVSCVDSWCSSEFSGVASIAPPYYWNGRSYFLSVVKIEKTGKLAPPPPPKSFSPFRDRLGMRTVPCTLPLEVCVCLYVREKRCCDFHQRQCN